MSPPQSPFTAVSHSVLTSLLLLLLLLLLVLPALLLP
jgi:hypothetical protein